MMKKDRVLGIATMISAGVIGGVIVKGYRSAKAQKDLEYEVGLKLAAENYRHKEGL